MEMQILKLFPCLVAAFKYEHLAQLPYLKYKYIKALFKYTQNTVQF